jgi:hypothetical protein
MPDLPTYPDADGDTRDDTGMWTGRESPPGTPRWVKIVGIVALIVALLIVVVMLVGGGGGHGPGRHAPPSNIVVHGVR